ncbi:MAG: hypothetical protein WC438_03340 [Candidatus Pacearchaeota archaeon]
MESADIKINVQHLTFQGKPKPLEQLAEAENKIRKHHIKIYNQRSLHDFWIQHPVLYAVPTALAYIYYKIKRQI